MTNFDLQLTKLICFNQLNLKSGDSLSINTEESTYSFALEFSKFATKITNLPINIVVTENGKVSQTVPVEPNLLDIQKPQVKTQIMCRILDLAKFPYLNQVDLENIINSVVNISKYGILSEPIDLKRRIAIPWTIVAYPSKEFVKHAFFEGSETEALAYFAKLLRFDNENLISYWNNQATLLQYRVSELNSLNNFIEFKSRNSKFKASMAEGSNWASNYITLKNKRSFYNFLPTQNMHNNFDYTSFNGHIEASRDFFLFGKLVKGASFNFKNGEITSFNANENKEALEAFFKCDTTSSYVSGISICDEDSIESKYIMKNAHPLYSFENCTSIILGGATQDSLINLDEETDLDKLNINQSLVKLAIPIGDTSSNISIGGKIIVKEGNFIF